VSLSTIFFLLVQGGLFTPCLLRSNLCISGWCCVRCKPVQKSAVYAPSVHQFCWSTFCAYARSTELFCINRLPNKCQKVWCEEQATKFVFLAQNISSLSKFIQFVIWIALLIYIPSTDWGSAPSRVIQSEGVCTDGILLILQDEHSLSPRLPKKALTFKIAPVSRRSCVEKLNFCVA